MMTKDQLLQSRRFHDFVATVNRQLSQLRPEAATLALNLADEQRDLQEKMAGWLQSLAKSDLSSALRTALEHQYAVANDRISELEAELDRVRHAESTREHLTSPEVVADQLVQQGELLAGQNASAMNLLLSQHIEGIYCDTDGRARVRVCKLGAFAGAIELIPRETQPTMRLPASTPAQYPGRPRRRARLDAGDALTDQEALDEANRFAVDPQRFGGLGEEWFEERILEPPQQSSWAAEHARDVAEFRLQHHATMQRTAQHFQKSIPTIRAALEVAYRTLGLDAIGIAISQPAKTSWSKEHADQVREYFARGSVKMADAVAHFGKSEPTLRKALRLAEA